MNEITAAIREVIKNKATEHVTKLRISSASVDRVRDTRAFNSYTCGGEDAIGVHEKFDHWKADNYWQYFKQEKKYYNMVDNTVNPLTYTELFAKYLMEENKL